MTTETHEPSTTTGDALSAEQIREYLEGHPDFLVDHADLLEQIVVPHTGGGKSLLEHQASVLRDKNRELKTKLLNYTSIATDNEARLQKLHDLHLDMLHAADLGDLLDRVVHRLREEFDCDQALIMMFGSTSAQHPSLKLAGQQAGLFDDVRKANESICGRLRSDKLKLLFGEQAAEIKSAALAPLDDCTELGLLALGSSDESKFHPGMGTLFLTLLGQMLGQAMLPLLARE